MFLLLRVVVGQVRIVDQVVVLAVSEPTHKHWLLLLDTQLPLVYLALTTRKQLAVETHRLLVPPQSHQLVVDRVEFSLRRLTILVTLVVREAVSHWVVLLDRATLEDFPRLRVLRAVIKLTVLKVAQVVAQEESVAGQRLGILLVHPMIMKLVQTKLMLRAVLVDQQVLQRVQLQVRVLRELLVLPLRMAL
jgi:hypothetical protein